MAKPELAFHSPYLRSYARTRLEVVEHSVDLIAAMCRATHRDDLGATDLLDMGCGVKFSQAILTYDLPLRSYTGVDVYAEMIDFLQHTVGDERFRYLHHDVVNELYNPGATETLATSEIPVPEASFDVVCGFSLFTHLAPHDFRLMLERTRRAARDDSWLYFTAFLDELTAGGHGFADTVALSMGWTEADLPPLAERADYREGNPDIPLEVSVYSRKHALELVEGSGWEVVEVVDPTPHAQHQFVCRAV